MEGQTSFKCKKCRMSLFNSDILTNAHGESVGEIGAMGDSCSSDDGTIWFLKDDQLPNWLHKFVEESAWIKGKIVCPKCGFRLGSFDFVSGSQCSCRHAVLPAVHIKKAKVDCQCSHPHLQDPKKEQAKILPSLVLMNHAGRNLHQNQEAASPSAEALHGSDVATQDASVSFETNSIPSRDESSSKNNTDEEGTTTDNQEKRNKQPAEDLICPVCLEVYYEATACIPCGHIFCEPCLRNLGKKKPTATACPLCRQLIQQCLPQAGLRKMVAVKFPLLYKDRKLFEQKIPTSDFPLPWQPGYHFRRSSDLSQDQHYSLQNLLFSIPSENSSESGTLTLSASSLIVVISLLTVFMITLLAGYLCIRYFIVGILDMSAEETRYVVFVVFHLFVAFVIRWYFRYQVRSSVDANH